MHIFPRGVYLLLRPNYTFTHTHAHWVGICAKTKNRAAVKQGRRGEKLRRLSNFGKGDFRYDVAVKTGEVLDCVDLLRRA